MTFLYTSLSTSLAPFAASPTPISADTTYLTLASAIETGLLQDGFITSGSGAIARTYTAGTGLTLLNNIFSLSAPVPVSLGGTGLTSLAGLQSGSFSGTFTGSFFGDGSRLTRSDSHS